MRRDGPFERPWERSDLSKGGHWLELAIVQHSLVAVRENKATHLDKCTSLRMIGSKSGVTYVN